MYDHLSGISRKFDGAPSADSLVHFMDYVGFSFKPVNLEYTVKQEVHVTLKPCQLLKYPFQKKNQETRIMAFGHHSVPGIIDSRVVRR